MVKNANIIDEGACYNYQNIEFSYRESYVGCVQNDLITVPHDLVQKFYTVYRNTHYINKKYK